VAFNSAFFTVSMTPVLIATGNGRTKVLIRPDSALVVGDSSITAATGYIVPATPIEFEIGDGDEIWAVRQSLDVGVSVITIN
jgi:hypothetical protein